MHISAEVGGRNRFMALFATMQIKPTPPPHFSPPASVSPPTRAQQLRSAANHAAIQRNSPHVVPTHGSDSRRSRHSQKPAAHMQATIRQGKATGLTGDNEALLRDSMQAPKGSQAVSRDSVQVPRKNEGVHRDSEGLPRDSKAVPWVTENQSSVADDAASQSNLQLPSTAGMQSTEGAATANAASLDAGAAQGASHCVEQQPSNGEDLAVHVSQHSLQDAGRYCQAYVPDRLVAIHVRSELTDSHFDM